MGGGDLNLKKSWHPLLHSNQEKVWQAERKAIEEKKRFKELEKERKEERELQELRRLGGKIDDRVEWIYAAPAQGNGPSLEEQEQYLLGKKRVDQLFKEQDEKRLAALKASSAPGDAPEHGGGAVNTFQALGGNANSLRDLAAKVREDPMLAIKKQELAALEAYRKDPARLRALQSEQQEKAEKVARKEERQRRREDKEARREARENGKRERSYSPERSRDHRRSYSPDRRDYDRSRNGCYGDDHRRVKREDSPDGHRKRRDDSPEYRRPRRDSPDPYERPSHRNNGYSNGHHRERSPYQRPPRRDYDRSERPSGALPPDPEAAARLAAMTASAAQLQAQRKDRITESDKREAAILEKEQAERARNAKIGDQSARFVRQESSKSGEGGLANALRGARAAGARIDRD